MFELIPEDRPARWQMLAQLAKDWRAPIKSGDGYTEDELTRAEQKLGVALPIALREWYAQSGTRKDLWSYQDEFYPPKKLRVVKDVLIFYCENQGVFVWGIRISDLLKIDPPVLVGDENANGWKICSETLSEFALQMFVMNMKWWNKFSNNSGDVSEQAFEIIANTYRRLPFADFSFPVTPTRFYGSDDLVIEQHSNAWIWVTGRTEAALKEFQKKLFPLVKQWEQDS